MKGIIVAKEGANTKSNTDQLYMYTPTPLFKLFKSDSGERSYVNANLNFGAGGAADQFKIPHGLGYIPMYFLYMDRASQANRKLVLSYDGTFAGNTAFITCFVDTQNITVTVSSGANTTARFGYNYFIFYDRAS